MKIIKTRADELIPGDKIRLLFMGGSEDVEVVQNVKFKNGKHGLELWSVVTGTIKDIVEPDKIVRKV